MPFKSERQRRFLHMTHPDMAKKWENEHGGKPKKNNSPALKPKRRRLKPTKPY